MIYQGFLYYAFGMEGIVPEGWLINTPLSWVDILALQEDGSRTYPVKTRKVQICLLKSLEKNHYHHIDFSRASPYYFIQPTVT